MKRFLGGLAAGGLAIALQAADRPLVAMDTCTMVQYPHSHVHRPEQQLDWLRQYGYAGIAWTAEDPAAVAAAAAAGAARGVPMTAIYIGAELTREGLKVDGRLPAIAAALKDHGTLLWLHLTSKAFKPSDPAGDALAVPELQRVADLAAGHGLRVAIYPHTSFWAERVGDGVRLAQQVGRTNFGVTFNLCHSLMVGEEADIRALLDRAAPHLFMVTLNGADAGAARTSWNRLIRPLGEGTYDVAAFVRELDRIGYRGPIALQGYGLNRPPEDRLAPSMQAWRTQIAGGWTALPFAGVLEAWSPKRGDWQAAGGVKLDPTNDQRLVAQPGAGVAVNGANGRTADLLSAEEAGDLDLHVEFLLGRKSNSGVYVMGRYEVQIYDSFGVEKDAYPGIECGGIYPRWVGGRKVEGHGPRVNAARAPGEWQSFDIVFRAPRFDAAGQKIENARFVRVLHNGQVVQENVELTGPTRGGYEPEVAKAALRLQGDHGPVAYRNVRWRTP